ncbi:MAG: DUF3800 domain-containing protein [Bacillota bacterium]
MKYRIYIDETGNSDLKNSDNPNHRYLSLSGVIIEMNYADMIVYPQLEALKRKYFVYHSDDPVVFHRKELLNKLHPFEVLRDGVVEKSFNEDLLELLRGWEYSVVTVFIDMKAHLEVFAEWRYDPYHYCLAVMLERYIAFLRERDAKGDVMAEARGGTEDRRLKEVYSDLYDNGTENIAGESLGRFLTSRQLKMKGKIANIAGLQLADLIAHPSRRHAMKEFAIDVSVETRVFGDQIVDIVLDKYFSLDGKYLGNGLNKLP